MGKLSEFGIYTIGAASAALAGTALEPLLRGEHALPGIPDVFRHTTHDMFIGLCGSLTFVASMSFISVNNEKPTHNQTLIMGAIVGFIIPASVETLQGIAQSLGITDRGFAWIDYVAYAIGAFAPLASHATIQLLANKNR